mgnify:FL=1
MTNILAIIPARGESKGIKNKNIVNFCGKPLIYWTIKAAQNSKYIDRVIVSTDSKRIREIAEKYDVQRNSLRPKKYSTDYATTLSVLKYEIKKQEKKNYYPDIIVTLQPTSPLRNAHHVDSALKLFLKNKRADSLVSCMEVPHNFNPKSLMKLKGKYLIEVKKDDNNYSRHLKNTLYARNGAAIYITRRSLIEKKLFNDFTIPFEMNRFVSVDIDSKDDLLIASMFYKYLKEKNEKSNS